MDASSPHVSMPAVADSIPVRLMRARESVMARLRPILRAHGVTEQQWRVLRTVRDMGQSEVTVLAERVFLLPPSLSRILRDLETRRLMVRRISRDDQRRSIVSLTPAGYVLIDQTEPEIAKAASEIRGLYGLHRMGELERLLGELEAALGARDPT